MLILTKENITDYLKEKMPDLDTSKPFIISAVGEGPEEEDGDGFVNYVFRVSDGKKKLIVEKAVSPFLLSVDFTNINPWRFVKQLCRIIFRIFISSIMKTTFL